MDNLDHEFHRSESRIERNEYGVRKGCPCRPPRTGCGRFFAGCCFCISCFFLRFNLRSVTKGGLLFGLFWVVILLGALFYWGVEGSYECALLGVPFPSGLQTWTYASSVYFCIITATTIGYGDMSPETVGGKVFTIFYGSISIATVIAMTGYLTTSLVDFFNRRKEYLVPTLMKWGASEKLAKFIRDYRMWFFVLSLYIVLLLLGAVLFGWAEPFEPPKFLNGIYFSFITLATIGYGDLLPRHAGTRLWACIYALFGVGIYGFMMSTLASKYTKNLENQDRREKPTFSVLLGKAEELLDDAKYLSTADQEILMNYITTSIQQDTRRTRK